eukprot:PhM_4_TR2698/c0_g1_i1/m.3139/K08517/SEC22; vesicle transport protein SEC22
MLITLISRVSDGLALSADTSEPPAGSGFPNLEGYKAQAKNLLRRLAPGGASGRDYSDMNAMSIHNGDVTFHILKEGGVYFLTMCEATSSAAISFAYLEDISKEFLMQHGSSVDSAQRPYCFIRFDMFLQKSKRVYMNPSQRAAASSTTSKYTITKLKFDEVMGYVSQNTTSGATDSQAQIVLIAAIFLALFVIAVVLWLTLN